MGLTCRDVMVSRDHQKTIHPDASVADAYAIFKETRIRFLPVVDDAGVYLGVFTSPTLMRMLLPQAVTIGRSESAMAAMPNLGFMSLSQENFEERVATLKNERVVDNMSNPDNIPVAHPDDPILHGIFMIYKFKRHLMLLEPGTNKFVGTVSANSVLDHTPS